MSNADLKLVSITGAVSNLNDALMACLESRMFHIENAGKLLGRNDESTTLAADANPYADALRQLLNFDYRRVPLHPELPILPGRYTPERIFREISRISQKLQPLRDDALQTRESLSSLEAVRVHLTHMQSADIDLGQLAACKHVVFRFGRMPAESLKKLSFYDDLDMIFRSYDISHEYAWGFYFTTPDKLDTIDVILKGLFFEEFEMPKDLEGTPAQALASVTTRIADGQTTLAKLETQIQQIYTEEAPLLDELYRYAKYQTEVYKLCSQCSISKDRFQIMGYIPAEKESEFRAVVTKVPDLVLTFDEPLTDSQHQPPVRLKSNWFTKPFSLFVEMYGMPSYNGFNPTTLVALTYTLLFGIMFGDLGQGLVLAILGLFLEKKKDMPMGGIIARVGFSSAFFGFFYGSVFGYEHLLDPLFAKIGLDGFPLHAMTHTNLFIYGAIIIGAVLIFLVILINTIYRFKQKNYTEAVFGSNGICGLVFYSALAVLLAGLLLFDFNLAHPAYIFFCLVLPVVLMFFREPLGAKLEHKEIEKVSVGDFIASNFFECFEILLSYVTNTLSFIRVGGFVFSHVGLMSVVMMLAEGVNGGASMIVVILGNLFVMGVEGMLVGIQVLRLEFYELFSRCYDGDGTAFTPMSIRFDEVQDLQPQA